MSDNSDHEGKVPPIPLADLTVLEQPDHWLVCGRFGRPHGLRGEVRLWEHNKKTELLKEGMTLYVGAHPRFPSDDPSPATHQLTLTKVRADGKGLIAQFKELRYRDQVQWLNHRAWLTPRDALPQLDQDEFYLMDLIGAQGWAVDPSCDRFEETPNDDNATFIGRLTGLLEAGAGELLIFEGGACGEVNIPNQEPFVISIDVEQKRVIVRAIPGLLEGGL